MTQPQSLVGRNGSVGANTYAAAVDFDPDTGIVVREPERPEPGYWAGAPGVCRDPATGDILLTYRRRRPRGAPPERGHTCYIARSRDGVVFTDVWSIDKADLATASMERCCLRPRGAGGWLLYVSYVDPADGRWRIDALSGPAVDTFKVDDLHPILSAHDTGTEGVKDPYITRAGPAWLMFASYAAPATLTPAQLAQAHATADIYTTGATTAPTGLASSLDGTTYHWHGETFPVGHGWDAYQARLGGVLPLGAGYLGFYDGSADVGENYEERCGLALSFDLRQWLRLTTDHPHLRSPHGSGSLRYVDALHIDGEVLVYYEYARPDGAHDLRVAVVSQNVPVGT